MASFAKLNLENIVENVISVNNEVLLENGIEKEQKGIDFLKSIYGVDTKWKQTSYNTKGGMHYLSNNFGPSLTQEKAFRKNFACIGMIYDESRDAFIQPQPYPSWILDEDTCWWEAPTPEPNDGPIYDWDETTKSWIPRN